jgi:iron complex transport system substrate-binding protein
MRAVVHRIWRWGLFGALVSVVLLSALGCGGDEQEQSSAGADVAEQLQQQDAAEAERQRDSAAPQEQPVQERPEQEQQRLSVEQQEAQVQQQSRAQSEATDQTEQQSAPAQDQNRQQAKQAVDEESVAEGTRLISLFGDITEIVYALGVQDYLVARDTSSIYPREVEALPNLGFAGGLNAEAILAFEPTIVIGTPMAGPPGVLEQLEQAGVEVLIVDDFNSLDAPQIKIRMVGEALGIPQRAAELALDVGRRMEVVTAAAVTDDPLRVLLVYIRRGGLQLVSGEGNKSQVIIEAAGAIDAATEAGIVGWQPLTPEALVASDPDVYLVMDRGLAVVDGIEGLLEIPGMAETKAGQNRHIISMPDLYLLGFGPRLPEAIADLAGFLQEIRSEIVSE